MHTNFQAMRYGYCGDDAEVMRVFEMLSSLSEISVLECKRKRIKTSNGENR